MNPETLRSIAVFASVHEGHLQDLAGRARETVVPPGVDLVRQGDYANDFVAILEGEAEVHCDGEMVGLLGSGDGIGEIGAQEHAPRIVTVTARTPMRLVTFTRWDLDRLGQDTLAEIRDRLDRRLTVHIDQESL